MAQSTAQANAGTANDQQGFTRLYLVPIKGQQQIVDVPSDVLILSEGQFVPPQIAQSLTLTAAPTNGDFTPFSPSAEDQKLTINATSEVRICFREPADVQQYPDTDVVEAVDPSGGTCVCGVTCQGTNLQYVKVYNIPPIV